MNAAQLFADINSGCLYEVEAAASSYDCLVRGLLVRQSFYVYPDGSIVCLNSVDGGYSVLQLDNDDIAIFSHLYLKEIPA